MADSLNIVEYRCADGCGRLVVLSKNADPIFEGWQELPVTRRWRCPQCVQALAEINSQGGSSVCPISGRPEPDCESCQ